MEKVNRVVKSLTRFAEYGDLKKLHAIVVPEIAKFEN